MQKKIPMRQCLGCREMKPKRELIRAVKSPEGVISLDFKGKAAGRGAYICPSKDCLKKAIKGKALEKAFPRRYRPRCTKSLNGRWRRQSEGKST